MSVCFSVDLDELEDAIARMARFQQRLDDQLGQLDHTVADLHDGWAGRAAQSQRDAHQQWRQGARFMHEALAQIAEAARHAHGSYWRAAETNATMWADLAG